MFYLLLQVPDIVFQVSVPYTAAFVILLLLLVYVIKSFLP